MTLPSAVRSGRHPVAALRATEPHAKSRHHLVEYEERAIPARELPQPLEEPGFRQDEPGVSHDRLEEDGRNRVAPAPEYLLDGLDVVEGEEERRLRRLPRHPRRVGESERRDPAPGGHEEGIRVAVIAPGELDEARPSGDRPGHPERAHRRLRPRVHEPHHLDPGDESDKPLCKLHLRPGRRAVTRSLPELLLERPGHDGVRVAEDQGTPREDVVEVAPTLGIDEVRSLPALDEEGLAIDGAKGAHG